MLFSNQPDRFQGDPYVYMTSNGLAMKFVDGQPIMDQGFENSVLLSILLTEDWPLNPLLPAEAQLIRSKFLTAVKSAITSDTLNNARTGLNNDLAFLVSKGYASRIQVDVTNPTGYITEAKIFIYLPNGDAVEIMARNNGANVFLQATYPANERI